MDFLIDLLLETWFIYTVTFLICFGLVFFYMVHEKNKSKEIQKKIEEAKELGRFEPISLHPFIDLDSCIGSGACVKACPEEDVIGVVNGKASVINATSCIGHGACFHACPVEAISLRIGTETRGVDLPHIQPNYETNIPGIFIAGELGGMGLIKNSIEQGVQAINYLAEKRLPSSPDRLDLIIVGAGPAGIGAGLNAIQKGLTFEILEQDSLGGTVFTFPREKVIMTRPVDLPLYGKVKFFNTSKQEVLTFWKSLIKDYKIIVREHTKVESIVPLPEGGFRIKAASGEEFESNQILLALGRRGTPRKLDIPGEDLPKVFYRLLEPEHFQNMDILVVGGGDSAVESAMLLMDTNRVTLSYRSEKFARIKPQNQKNLEDAIAKGKLQVILNSEAKEIKETSVRLWKKDQNIEESIPNDRIFIFAGGELPLPFLKNIGINVEKKFGKVVRVHKSKSKKS